MKKLERLFSTIKNFTFLIPISMMLYPLNKVMLYIHWYNKMIVWMWSHRNDFLNKDLSLIRKYDKRYDHYRQIISQYQLSTEKIIYLEFGVGSGASLEWWMKNNTHKSSSFFGFDTFNGLPEPYGIFYKAGDMKSEDKVYSDERVTLWKGLFQETMGPFLDWYRPILDNRHIDRPRLILHMDADLYSSTIFTLISLLPYLKNGDVVIFDEFNVPLHEFRAYTEFQNISGGILHPLFSVNNFHQTSFVVLNKK